MPFCCVFLKRTIPKNIKFIIKFKSIDKVLLREFNGKRLMSAIFKSTEASLARQAAYSLNFLA